MWNFGYVSIMNKDLKDKLRLKTKLKGKYLWCRACENIKTCHLKRNVEWKYFNIEKKIIWAEDCPIIIGPFICDKYE